MFYSCHVQVRPVTDGINWKNGNECKKPFVIMGINGNKFPNRELLLMM